MTLVKSPVYFLCCLAHLLSCDIRQVIVLIVRLMISPHDKNNLQPLGAQSSKRLVMSMSFSPLIAIVFLRPLTAIKRVKREPVRGVSQQLIAGKTKVYDAALAALFGHWHCSCLGLKMVPRLPSIPGVAQLSPKHGHGGPSFSSRQRLSKLSCRHRAEKIFDLLLVAVYGWQQGLKLNDQRCKQLGLGSNHMPGNRQLRLAELLPELVTALLTQVMVAFGKTVPLSAPKIGESPWSRVLLEKIQRNLRLQIRKNLQGSRVILFERHLDLIKQPRFLAHQPVVIASEHLKLLGLLGIRPKRLQMRMIGSQNLRQYISIKGIALRLTHAKPIPGPIHGLGIHRIDHHAMIQHEIHNAPVRLLNRCPKLYAFCFSLIEPTAKIAHALGILLDLHLGYLLAFWINAQNLMNFIRPSTPK